MVELPVDGDINHKKWALIVNVNPGCYFGGSATQYFIGDFDGTKFICDNLPNVTKWRNTLLRSLFPEPYIGLEKCLQKKIQPVHLRIQPYLEILRMHLSIIK